MSIREKLRKRASRAGIPISEDLAEGLDAYFELLRKWNRKVSLTSLPVEDRGDEAIDRLLIEPVLAAKYFPQHDTKALDIGSGGGSPAIPMKLATPRMSMRMVESKTRKAAFLREAIRTLNLPATFVEAVRAAELLSHSELHESMDVVTLRAVRIDRKTLADVQSFIRPQGHLFLFGAATGSTASSTEPFFTPVATHTLLSQWGSRLEILQKITQ